ncbi:MAG: glycerophosphodiester phosphodiesterase family protein [Bacteroidota bacterium]
MRSILLFLLISIIVISCKTVEFETNPSELNQILEDFHNPSSQKVLIAAHRASNKKYPENSLAAIKYSIEMGVDIVEIDIRTTKDGKLVLMHDGTLKRTTNGEGNVKDFTYDELAKLELDSEWGDTITYKIPLAEEALKLAKGKIMIDLDIKDVYIKPLVNLVHKTNTEKQVLFFDGSFEILDSVLILDSTLMVMPRAHSLDDVKEIIERYHPPVIHIDPDFYTDEVVSTIKEGGARIWINALVFPDIKAWVGFVKWGYSPVIEKGANIIQSDLPVKLHKFLKEKNLR